jgi:hypothetical protein
VSSILVIFEGQRYVENKIEGNQSLKTIRIAGKTPLGKTLLEWRKISSKSALSFGDSLANKAKIRIEKFNGAVLLSVKIQSKSVVTSFFFSTVGKVL